MCIRLSDVISAADRWCHRIAVGFVDVDRACVSLDVNLTPPSRPQAWCFATGIHGQ